MNANDPSNRGQYDLEVYWKRWEALDETISALFTFYQQRPEFPRKNTVLHLLESLRAFAAGQFHFFYFGFAENSSALSQQQDPQRVRKSDDPALQESTRFPPPFVLDTVLLQIGHDLEGIQRAADQRIPDVGNTRKTLETADKLAWNAIKPAISDSAHRETATVLTYFQKSTDIRVIPYAQVALIGIPFSCSNNHLDYLAIPHEVGHYIYRHLSTNKDRQKLETAVKNQDETFQPWTEEIFADVYGALIAGPVIALDFQNQALQHGQDDFIQGDGEHPTPIVRPFIYNRILRSILDQNRALLGNRVAWENLVDELEANWKQRIEQLKLEPEFVVRTTIRPPKDLIKARGLSANSAPASTSSSADDNVTKIEERRKLIDYAITLRSPQTPDKDKGKLNAVVDDAVQEILKQICDYIDAHKSPQYNGYLTSWAGEITDTTRVDNLFEQYEDNFKNLVGDGTESPPDSNFKPVASPIWDADTHHSQLWLNWFTTQDNGFGGKYPPIYQPVKAGQEARPGEPQPDSWRYILFADGWNTEGPETVGSRP